MASASFPAIQAKDAFPIVPSDDGNLELDITNNPNGYLFAFIHNVGASAEFVVIPAGSITNTSITIYIQQGSVFPLAVKRVLATGSPASDIVGLV